MGERYKVLGMAAFMGNRFKVSGIMTFIDKIFNLHGPVTCLREVGRASDVNNYSTWYKVRGPKVFMGERHGMLEKASFSVRRQEVGSDMDSGVHG